MTAPVLRPYQQQALDEIRAAYRTGVRSVCYVLPTGAGKTATFTAIAEAAADKGKRILILVHRAELLWQARHKLHDLGVHSGVIKAGEQMALQWHVQVGSIQTVVRRLDVLPAPDLIICDEGHHATSASYQTVFDHWPDARRLLVTATPERLDGRGLSRVAEQMILGPDMRTLIEQGYLARPVVYAPPTVDTTKLHTVAGDYDQHEAEALMDTARITGSALDHYRRLCDGKPALAFCTSLKHAEHVAAEFRAAGYQAALIEGRHTDAERRTMLADLASGALNVLTSVSLIGEGIDVAGVQASILLRPTKSVTVFLQQVGRCLRPYPGKRCGLILDHVGTSLLHGLPTSDREWSLEGRKKSAGTRTQPVKQCPKCFCTHEPAVTCPECGHVYLVASREGPEQVEGELVELTESAEDFRKRQQQVADRREEGMARSLEDFQRIARVRGFKPGWAHVRWKIKQRQLAEQAAKRMRKMDRAAEGAAYE